jgi:hypothetical protein
MREIDSREMDRLVDEACAKVDEMCTPTLMTKSQAIDFLEDVVVRLEDSLDALRDEYANEEEAKSGESEDEEEGR